MALTPAEAEIARTYPRLYHMAAYGSWPSIKRHGMLSTRALVDLYGIRGGRRLELLSAHRPDSVPLDDPTLGKAVIRDQKPMSDSGLLRALPNDISPREWYETLNEKVFFWVDEKRLSTLLNAKAYRSEPHTVVVLDTIKVLALCASHVLLSPINSGATKPFAWPRGHDTFLPINLYPFEYWREKRNVRNAVVEFAVTDRVPDVEVATVSVYHQYPTGRRDPLC
jgi:hypothetical protein